MTFVILTPALACPSLVEREDYLEILLLAQTRENITDELSRITYSVWKSNKERDFDKKDIEILHFIPDNNISSYVLSAYKKRGYPYVVNARMKISLKKGLYQVNNPFSEDITSMIKDVRPPLYSRSPESPDGCAVCSFFSKEPVQLHHPFYVGQKEYLNIAHISDSHVAARMFMLEERWDSNFKDAWYRSSLSGEKPGEFSNYIDQFQNILKGINADKTIDMIIHTGDIVDYNRGYHREEEHDLSSGYIFNRNWLLFYELLLHHYEKPFFSVLGNHDYRLNPYRPNPAVLSTEVWELFNMAPSVNLTRNEMNTLHEDPHALAITENHLITAPQARQWYSLVINPLLDYQVFYGKMAFLMLDWNRREDHERGTPWAAQVLSDSQWELLKNWHRKVLKYREREKIISVVALHPSVFNPFLEMGDEKLYTAPETNVFYSRTLIDSYTPQKDLVDGTFRLRRNRFIALSLGNAEYGEGSHEITPEEGIDLILAGHAHRSGLFQVEGPSVYARKPDTIKEGPLFCNVISCGPIGVKNDKGGLEMVQLVPPGYHVIFVGNEGISVDVRTSDLVSIREETRRDFGEVGQGNKFQVMDSVSDLPGLNPTYFWKVQNLKKGSTITKIRIVTGLKTESIAVRSVPLGWRWSLEHSGGVFVIVCEAHDRGQGIFYTDWGEIHVGTEDSSAEKMGTLAVSWDMTDDLSPPVCVRVPG